MAQDGAATFRALVIEDSSDTRDGVVEWLTRQGVFPVRAAGTVEAARDLVATDRFDLVLLDLQLPDGDGLELLKDLERDHDSEIVIVTGHGTIDSAVEAVRGGAVDYLTKPVDLARLKKIVDNLRRTIKLRREVAMLRQELRGLGRFGSIIGSSPPMQKVYDLVARVAPTSSSVLIYGETGTGKEVVAETIHQLSRRPESPFLPVNCGAISATLIESEFFGHEKGSFTGAERQHKGVFERASGGTLFLDEITEMSPALQVRLLRVVESGTVTRVGSDRSVKVDVRLIAATNRDPREAVRAGKLREDLLYRLSVFPIELTPLRDREEDIELLAEHFLGRLNSDGGGGTRKRFSRDALQKLRGYGWPGNVRELRNVVERAFIIAGQEIGTGEIPLNSGSTPLSSPVKAAAGDAGMTVAEAERRLILATLEHCGRDKKKAAATLGISLKTLYNRLAHYRSDGR